MPLSKIQADILRLLGSNREPESYVAGATPLNEHTKRYSGDIDIFHDREERVATAAQNDAKTLETAGYDIKWIRRLPSIYTAEVTKQDAFTRLEWVVDSDFRFFPVTKDETFGFVLHPIDLAANKVMAAAGRHEVRDIADLVAIHKTILPLGAVIWAAVEKSPGFTPEGLIAEIRRNSNYSAAEWRALETVEAFDPKAITAQLRSALDEAESFVKRMPTEKIGLLFLQGGKIVQPDPSQLDSYQTHAGKQRGHWPSSPEIGAAMLDRYNKSSPSNDPKP